MAKIREVFRCSVCGAQSFQWHGQCPSCHEWNKMEAVQLGKSSRELKKSANNSFVPIPLAQVSGTDKAAYSSGLAALDRILGLGLMPGAAILVGGEPGIGKSTLFLQVAAKVAALGKTALYASGEESLGQIMSRAERLGILHPNLHGLATSRLEDILAVLESANSPDLLILDSVQTIVSQEAEGLPGNVSQVRAVSSALIEACRRSETTLVLIGHVTKDGSLAGPRMLEHMVDTVLALEGDRRQVFRLLRVFKNRFGPNEELLVFRMGQRGMEIVEDPATFFLDTRDTSLSGTAVVMAVDGQRPLAVEVQALVTRTFLNFPRRAALGFDANRLHLLLAVLEKRLKLSFAQVDIYAKVGGGIRIQDPALDLALVAAVLSSYYDRPLPEKSIFWGEVDLNGQIRPVSAQNQRYAQATRLGFSPIIQPERELALGNAGFVSGVAELPKKLFR